MHLKSVNQDHAKASGVFIEAPARLHLGFVDMHGGLGRRYGSLGLALESLSTQLTITPLPATGEPAATGERAARCARRLLDHLGIDAAVEVRVHASIPEHAGLGSGTQLSLAVGTAINQLFDAGLTVPTLCDIMGRGRRSGVGVGAFTQGGFLLDGGRCEKAGPPPIVARTDFPDAWRVLLILDHRAHGLYGRTEQQAFSDLPEFPAAAAAELCRLTLMQIMPALAEADFHCFADGIGALQQAVGDHFASAQGGRYSSARVAAALDWLRGQGVTGLGQSSWGPTGFAFLASADDAAAKAAALRRRFSGVPGMEFRVVEARNRGCRMITSRAPHAAPQTLDANRRRA